LRYSGFLFSSEIRFPLYSVKQSERTIGRRVNDVS